LTATPEPPTLTATIRAAIFDMDGVLTDSEPLIRAAAMAMFKEKGLIVQPGDFAPFVGMGEDRFIGGVAEKYSFPLDLPAAKRRTYEFYLELVPVRLEVFPGAVDLVRACRQSGLKIAVASSADRIKVVANLNKIGLPPESWDAIMTAEDVLAKKPAPDIFLAAAAKLGVLPPECVVIEDAVKGIAAAKAAGMRCVAVAQTFPAEQLAQADLVRPTIAATSLSQLRGESNPMGADAPGETCCRGGSSLPSIITEAGGAGTSSPIDPGLPPLIAAAPGIGHEPGPRPWGFWATLGLSTVVALALVSAQGIVYVFWMIIAAFSGHNPRREDVENNGMLLSLAICASAPIAVLLSWIFARARSGGAAASLLREPRTPGPVATTADYLGLRSVKPGALLKWSLMLLGIVVASDALTSALGRPIVPEFMKNAYQTAGFLPLLWLGLIVGAPLAEETLFRGFMFTGFLHSRVGAPGAIILTSLFWSLTHLQYDAYGIGTIFLSGLFLGLVRLRTGSIYATMFLHGLMNFVATVETAWVLNLRPKFI
jgi:beta-phosphoglucomutase